MSRLRISAFLLGCTMFAFAATPAAAGPYVSAGQWTSGVGDKFGRCWTRTGPALASVGLKWGQDGRYFKGTNDAFTVAVYCYDLGNRFIVTIVAAQSGASTMTTEYVRDQVMHYIFGSGAGTAPGGSGGGTTNGNYSGYAGRWSWSGTCNGSTYTGSFTIPSVNGDGTFGGAFQQNGTAAYDGTIAGRIQSGKVSFIRRWTGPDQQQWDGTLDQSRMVGNITGFGGPCTFTANR
jgi:hypothetical protein